MKFVYGTTAPPTPSENVNQHRNDLYAILFYVECDSTTHASEKYRLIDKKMV